jgi:hypothetical protein
MRQGGSPSISVQENRSSLTILLSAPSHDRLHGPLTRSIGAFHGYTPTTISFLPLIRFPFSRPIAPHAAYCRPNPNWAFSNAAGEVAAYRPVASTHPRLRPAAYCQHPVHAASCRRGTAIKCSCGAYPLAASQPICRPKLVILQLQRRPPRGQPLFAIAILKYVIHPGESSNSSQYKPDVLCIHTMPA